LNVSPNELIVAHFTVWDQQTRCPVFICERRIGLLVADLKLRQQITGWYQLQVEGPDGQTDKEATMLLCAELFIVIDYVPTRVSALAAEGTTNVRPPIHSFFFLFLFVTERTI
jgi:hypothetical protein